jgi:hypothetical protein
MTITGICYIRIERREASKGQKHKGERVRSVCKTIYMIDLEGRRRKRGKEIKSMEENQFKDLNYGR